MATRHSGAARCCRRERPKARNMVNWAALAPVLTGTSALPLCAPRGRPRSDVPTIYPTARKLKIFHVARILTCQPLNQTLFKKLINMQLKDSTNKNTSSYDSYYLAKNAPPILPRRALRDAMPAQAHRGLSALDHRRAG